jgi:lysosomal Pro-X carboxypeptidase
VSSTLGAYGNLAMGNYPYPSSYITSGESFLPAYPVRASCEFLRPDFAEDDYQGLLAAFRESVGVFYNSTKKETCYFPTESPSNVTDIDIKGNFWGYLECSELYMPMGSDGIHDVFPPAPANETADDEACFATWGVHVRPRWANTLYGGVKALRTTSNIVFSQGTFDPWSATGVTETLSDSVVYVSIEGGAHHLDLFFTHPLDPPAVTAARQLELQHIQKWIAEFYVNKASN